MIDTKTLPTGRQAKTSFPVKDPMASKTPGQGRKKRSAVSEYKKSLVEKQALKELYGLTEKQCKRYVKGVLANMQKVQSVSDALISQLEKRLDNVVFRMGLAKTRAQARQMVSHAYFTVNGKPVNIASFQVQAGDVVALKETKKKKKLLEIALTELKKHQAPKWLDVNKEQYSVKMIGNPTMAETSLPIEIQLVFEFYSR